MPERRRPFSPWGEGEDEGAFSPGRNVFQAQIVPLVTDALRGRPFLAFCGIGRPAKFFDTLHGAGIAVASMPRFPDHHALSEADARALIAEAKALKAGLITTAKDLVRLKGAAGALAELYRSGAARFR